MKQTVEGLLKEFNRVQKECIRAIYNGDMVLLEELKQERTHIQRQIRRLKQNEKV